MNTTLNTYNPDYAIHPGEYLNEILEAREIKQRELAERMGITEAYLSKLIHGEKPVGPDTAIKLERVLGVSSDIWNNLNANYKLFEARRKEKEIMIKNFDWVSEFPLKWFKKIGILEDTKKSEKLISNILDFFKVSSPEVWDKFYFKQAISYRKSESYTSNLKANMSWLRTAEIAASEVETGLYNQEKFIECLYEIRSLTLSDPVEFEPKMKRLCSEAGVALIFLPEPPKVHVYGATKWMNKQKAMIVLSLRRKSDDQFWFSFFHEAGHIVLHGKNEVFIDDENHENDKEEEAHEFSRDILIPPDKYKKFVKNNSFYKEDILAFSKEMNIAPGIIVGFLQHDGYLKYSFHNGLKRRFELSFSVPKIPKRQITQH